MSGALVGVMLGLACMAAVLTALGCRALLARAARWNLIDRPSGRKNHARPTPTAGGLAFWPAMVALPAVVVVAVAVLGEAGKLPAELQESIVLLHSNSTTTEFALARIALLAIVATGLMLLGLWDDLRGIAWPLRLTAEVVAGVATVVAGFSFRHLPWLSGESHFVGLLLDGLSVLWIVGLINSLNMLDNMDALAGGVAWVVGLSLIGCGWTWSPAAISWWMFFACGLVGSLTAFLLFNKPPAQLFMGDAGSYPLGYLLAVLGLTMPAHGSLDAQQTVLSLLCLFAVPLYDTASVVALRLRAGASPFHADHRHLSHRLVAVGFSSGRAVAAIALLAAVGATPALLMPFAPRWGTAAAIAVCGCFAFVLPLAEFVAYRAAQKRRPTQRNTERAGRSP